MTFKLLALVTALSLVGCSSMKRGEGEFEQIRNQKLSTTEHLGNREIEQPEGRYERERASQSTERTRRFGNAVFVSL